MKGEFIMDLFELMDSVDRLKSIIVSIKSVRQNVENGTLLGNINGLLEDVKVELNQIFPLIKCTDILWTLNTDKQFFGIKIDPAITPKEALNIFITDNPVSFGMYKVEFDSKLFDIGVDEEEIVSMLLYEIDSMLCSTATLDILRGLIDIHVFENDTINLRNSVNYSQLLIFGIKDTLYKVSSLMFKEDLEDLTSNKLIQALELTDSLVSSQRKIVESVFGVGDTVRSPKTIVLKWVFMVYNDMEHNSRLIVETLKDSMDFTGSALERQELSKTINAIDKIRYNSGDNHLKESAPINKVLSEAGIESIGEISLFKSLKNSGLKSIEDQYYEYSIRIKNCETEEDAMFIIRGINSRLSILEDYIWNTPDITEGERKRWEALANRYRELRETIIKKKIYNKKQYGLFIDYNQLDQLDNQ